MVEIGDNRQDTYRAALDFGVPVSERFQWSWLIRKRKRYEGEKEFLIVIVSHNFFEFFLDRFISLSTTS